MIDIDQKKLGGLYVTLILASGTFSVFCLIHDTSFIFYGFITFLYALVAQVWDTCFHHIYISTPNNDKPFRLYFIVSGIILVGYILLLVTHWLKFN